MYLVHAVGFSAFFKTCVVQLTAKRKSFYQRLLLLCVRVKPVLERFSTYLMRVGSLVVSFDDQHILSYGYRKPSAKAPMIDPGDEAPFLLWGGEGSALCCLTEGIGPAMIRIEVLY